jgi:glycosyltransferase involved in cell wall biosynthesis
MRIGIDATSWTSRRGFGRFTRNAVGRLVERDTSTEFVFFVDDLGSAPPGLPDAVEVCHVRLSRSPSEAAARGSSRSVRDLLRLTNAVRSRHLDAFLFPSLYTWFPVVGTPTIVGVHDAMAEELPELISPSRRDRIALQLKHRAGIRTATTLFTVSETARRAITARFEIPAGRLRIVPEAPDPVFAPRNGPALISGLAAAGLAPGEEFFLFFGGISPHKNVETLVDAYAALRREQKTPPLLVLVGELEESAYASAAASVRERILRHGVEASVRLPGYVSDETLACLCTAATAVVLPSLAEGFGLPAVEAAACGAPLALSELDAHRETLGDAALFFPPTDVAALTDTLARLAADEPLRLSLSARGHARVAGRSWEHAAAALSAVISATVRRP